MRKRPTADVLAEVDDALAMKPPTTSTALRREIRDLTKHMRDVNLLPDTASPLPTQTRKTT